MLSLRVIAGVLMTDKSHRDKFIFLYFQLENAHFRNLLKEVCPKIPVQRICIGINDILFATNQIALISVILLCWNYDIFE